MIVGGAIKGGVLVAEAFLEEFQKTIRERSLSFVQAHGIVE